MYQDSVALFVMRDARGYAGSSSHASGASWKKCVMLMLRHVWRHSACDGVCRKKVGSCVMGRMLSLNPGPNTSSSTISTSLPSDSVFVITCASTAGDGLLARRPRLMWWSAVGVNSRPRCGGRGRPRGVLRDGGAGRC